MKNTIRKTIFFLKKQFWLHCFYTLKHEPAKQILRTSIRKKPKKKTTENIPNKKTTDKNHQNINKSKK